MNELEKLLTDLMNRYKISEYEDVVTFYESVETPTYVPFEGTGTFWLSDVPNDFIVIDKDVVVFLQDRDNYLKGIVRLDMSILDSTTFKDAIEADCIHYKDFELEIMAEVKMYQHTEEVELVISPSKKIDLLKKISLYIAENGIKYKGQDFASVDEVLKAERLQQLIDMRMNKLIEDREKRKREGQ